MKIKVCSKCNIEKPVTAFSPDPRHIDGLQSQCKACKKIYRMTHKEEASEYRRVHRKEAADYRQSPAGKEAQKRGDRKSRLKFPEKEKAKQAVKYAVHVGKLKKSVFCEECGLPKETEGHHPDYSKLLDIDWVCRQCHRILHKKNVLEFIQKVG